MKHESTPRGNILFGLGIQFFRTLCELIHDLFFFVMPKISKLQNYGFIKKQELNLGTTKRNLLRTINAKIVR